MKELHFTVPGRPVSLNGTYERRSFAQGGGGLRLTDAAQDYFARIQSAAVQALGHVRCPFTAGIVIVAQAWFTRDADAGAVGKLVQDALQSLVYRNDREVAFAGGWKGGIDPEHPRTEVLVRQITDEEVSSRRLVLEIPIMTGPAENRAAFRALLGPKARERLNRGRLHPSVRRFGP
jgi:hypothetical protein